MFVSTYNKRFLHIIALLLGWQPRWFVLEVGVLAYYKSQEEVGLGSRGSVKMTCCEISGKLEFLAVAYTIKSKDNNQCTHQWMTLLTNAMVSMTPSLT